MAVFAATNRLWQDGTGDFALVNEDYGLNEPERARTASQHQRTLYALIFVAFIFAIAACWLIPWRLSHGPGGSYYRFGYLNDEYSYAQRIQPLLPGATSTNPVNGVCDPNIWSPFFLEDSFRALLTVTHLDVIAFAWIWRLLTPILLGIFFFLIARAAIARRQRPWSLALSAACAAAALPLLYCAYTQTNGAVPLYLFINRMPTNVEYFVSALLAWLYVRFVRRPDVLGASALALAFVALVYLRIYVAVPWALALMLGVGWMIVNRRVTARAWLSATCVAGVALLPWILINHHNGSIPAFRELLARYYPDIPYYPHPQWIVHVSAAALMMLLGGFAPRGRVVIFSMALALGIFPFVCGLLKPIQQELLLSDRYGCFYLVGLLTAAMLWLGARAENWSGHDGSRRALLPSTALLAISLLASANVWRESSTYDFESLPSGCTASIAADVDYLPAYDWVRQKTPAGALFLVDDGYDWRNFPDDDAAAADVLHRLECTNDLFQIVARRKRVYTEIIRGLAMSEADLWTLIRVQRGTLGLKGNKDDYVRALKKILPDYIFWRKRAPVVLPGPAAPIPRGYSTFLTPLSRTVYKDEFCEIWEMHYSGL
ncbi:MAG TPA: hypothetical protein VGP72_06665 [Planctomycetota bacterium]